MVTSDMNVFGWLSSWSATISRAHLHHHLEIAPQRVKFEAEAVGGSFRCSEAFDCTHFLAEDSVSQVARTVPGFAFNNAIMTL